MDTVKSVVSLAQAERELDLEDQQIATYVKLGYLTPLVKIDQKEDGYICEPFFQYRRKDRDYFHFDVVTYGEEICFDCREVQSLMERRLDLAKQVDSCVGVKPDPSFVPVWERQEPSASSTLPRACQLHVPALNGGHSEEHAQDQGKRIAELERENQRLKDELKRKPTLFGNDMAEGLARGVVESQAKLEKQMLASMPRYGLLNNVEAERDRAMKRVAELERQLAEGDSIRGQVEHGTRSEEVEQQLAGAQDEIARLKEQLAGHAAQAQGVDASQAEALKLEREAHARTREDLAAAQARITELERQLAQEQDRAESLEAALAQERKEPTGKARNTYLELLDALLFKAGIKCENVRGAKNSETGMIKNILALAGRSLTENTIREKIKELQSYIEKKPRGEKRK